MALLRVEVVYATPDQQEVVQVELAPGARVIDALEASALAQRYPVIDGHRVGIFGVEVSQQATLADGDRVEIYRPLAFDPKEARRARARVRPTKR